MAKGETFLVSHDNGMLSRVILCCLYSSCLLQEMTPSPFSLGKKRIYSDTHLKEEHTNLFLKLQEYSSFPTVSVETGWWTRCWGLILPLFVRDNLLDKSTLFSHISLMQDKPGVYLQQSKRILTLNPQLFSQQIEERTANW